MNPGTYAGVGSGASGDTITGFQQSHIIKTSQSITAPAGTKRIEALIAGGGGSGGGNTGGGGFGGLAVMGIPVTGRPYDIVVGAGGINSAPGNPSQVWSAGMMYAEVGGGGGHGAGEAKNGRSGGSGSGSGSQNFGGHGGAPPFGELLWYYAPTYSNITWQPRNTAYPETVYGTNNAGFGAYYNGNSGTYALQAIRGSLGGGGGGGSAAIGPAYGGGGGGGEPTYGGTAGNLGGGGGSMSNGGVYAGGSLTTVSIWGITGKANGNGANGGAGGGGGLLGAGVTGSYTLGALIGYTSDWDPIYYVNYTGGDGGDGGGGGGGVYVPGFVQVYYDAQGQYWDQYVQPIGPNLRNGNGGNGFVILRFFF
jgi:hypothetical protein